MLPFRQHLGSKRNMRDGFARNLALLSHAPILLELHPLRGRFRPRALRESALVDRSQRDIGLEIVPDYVSDKTSRETSCRFTFCAESRGLIW